DEPRDLLQAPAELALVLRSIGWNVWSAVDGFDHLERVKGLLPRCHERGIAGCRVHRLENASRVLIAYLKLFESIDGHRRPAAVQRVWQLRADGYRAKGRDRGPGLRERTIQPAIFAQ